MARYIHQAERLHALVDLAEHPDNSMVCYQRATDIVDASLQAIRELELVQVGGALGEIIKIGHQEETSAIVYLVEFGERAIGCFENELAPA